MRSNLKIAVASATTCACLALVVLSTTALTSHIEAETLKAEREATLRESYFVNDKVLENVTDNVIYLANKEGIEIEADLFSQGLADTAYINAVADAEQIKKEEEAKRIEEELKQAEAKKAVEIAKAKASGVDNSYVEQMTFAQTGDAVLTYNVFTKSNLTVDQFNQMLSGTALAGCGQSYYNMENTYNVNGVFAIALACHESANGYRTANTHNYYGMRAASGGWKSFQSADANIMYFGQYITGKMYYGKSIENIGKTYCPGTWSSWASMVKQHMNEKWKKISF